MWKNRGFSVVNIFYLHGFVPGSSFGFPALANHGLLTCLIVIDNTFVFTKIGLRQEKIANHHAFFSLSYQYRCSLFCYFIIPVICIVK